MSKPLSILEMLKQDVRYRDRIIISLVLMLVLLSAAFVRMPNQISVYHPPDLALNGQTTRIGEVPPSTVYAFASTFFERLMYCKNDCGEDYPNALINMKTYLTPGCFNQLKDHYENNLGLYKNRTRSINADENDIGFSFDKVQQINKKTWHVTENYILSEHVRSMPVRDVLMRYPLKIVKSNASTQINAYQMQLDCFFDDPKRINSDDLKK
jgi:integrating conjugative element protein (TIGR03746 family)